MAMSEGVRNIAYSAIDTVEETALSLINGGIPPEFAIKAAAIMGKDAVDSLIREKYTNHSASDITHTIKSQGATRTQIN